MLGLSTSLTAASKFVRMAQKFTLPTTQGSAAECAKFLTLTQEGAASFLPTVSATVANGMSGFTFVPLPVLVALPTGDSRRPGLFNLLM